jgi:hypothetical protein
VGVVFNEQGGKHSLSLDFLEQNCKYEATIYCDADDTHYISNKESYKVEKKEVGANEKITIDVVKGGGYSVLFRKK